MSAFMVKEYVNHGFDPNRLHNLSGYFGANGTDEERVMRLETLRPGQGDAADAAPEIRGPLENDFHHLLFLGRMDYLKGGRVLCASLPHVCAALNRPVLVTFAGDGPRAGEFLIGGQGDEGVVDAGLVEEGLVPGDERRRLPTLVVVVGRHGQPLRQKSDALPLPPAALLLRQAQGERQVEDDTLALADRAGQTHLQGGGVVLAEGERHGEGRCGRPGHLGRGRLLTAA